MIAFMLYKVYEGTDPNITQLEIAAITGFISLLVAIVGIFSARRFIHPRTPESDPDDKGRGHQSALASYSGDQNEFISLVIKDSKDLHARLDENDRLIRQMHKERTQIIGAFGRYISKLANAWGSGGKMPYPDTEDMALLEDTLPADWRRRRKS